MIAGLIAFGILMASTTNTSISQELGINELIAARPRTLLSRLVRQSQFGISVIELAGLVASPVFWKSKRGDGHSVLVIPGYGAGDFHLMAMRNWLQRVGYRPVKSGIDSNPGWWRRSSRNSADT